LKNLIRKNEPNKEAEDQNSFIAQLINGRKRWKNIMIWSQITVTRGVV